MRFALKESMRWAMAILAVVVLLGLLYFTGQNAGPPLWFSYLALLVLVVIGAIALLSPRVSDSSKSQLWCAVIITVFVATLVLMTGCGAKREAATTVLYEGGLVTNAEGQTYPSSGKVVEACYAAKACMGLADAELPEPKLKALAGGNAVPCGTKEDGTPKLKEGCYMRDGDTGWIIVPQGATTEVVKHECIHHWLYESSPDQNPDDRHESAFFLKCGSLDLIE